jgi:hypothetical protein
MESQEANRYRRRAREQRGSPTKKGRGYRPVTNKIQYGLIPLSHKAKQEQEQVDEIEVQRQSSHNSILTG